MLVNLKEVLDVADAKNCAVGSFNTTTLENILAVIRAAESLNQPVIISHAEVHEEIIPLKIIGPIMLQIAKKASVPVCVHLDHGTSLDYLSQALEIGFTSIMYDGSKLNYDLNVANTNIAVQMAKRKGASVEAEIGTMSEETSLNNRNQDKNESDIYTDPNMAKKFAKDTGVDALACSFGTVHGIYLKEPKLDYPRLKKINSLLNIPIVMHGGSGIEEKDYKKVIKNGVRKINYYTYMAKSGADEIKNKINESNDFLYHDIANWGTKAMKENVKSAIKVFSMKS